MCNVSRFQEEVGEWAANTFRQATDASIVAHLKREVVELEMDARRLNDMPGDTFWRDCMGAEIADCYMLLLHLAHRNGIDIVAEARKKFVINKSREWGPSDADGVCEHIEEAQDGT